ALAGWRADGHGPQSRLRAAPTGGEDPRPRPARLTGRTRARQSAPRFHRVAARLGLARPARPRRWTADLSRHARLSRWLAQAPLNERSGWECWFPTIWPSHRRRVRAHRRARLR